MSLTVFESFLKFAEQATAARLQLPSVIDPDELESALVSHGVVLLHSHIEQCLRNAIELRCSRSTDLELRAFALSVRDQKAGKIGIDSLKETLGKFSMRYKSKFKSYLDISGLGSSWDSVKNQRVAIAHHGNPATCTLSDLRLYYEEIRKILGFFCDGLELNATEAASISNLIVLPP